jgi:ketosteroid isomerase-like protein
MTTALRLVLLLGVTFAVARISAFAADARAIETEIRQLDASRVDALLKHDLKALEQLFAADMVYVHSAGKIDTKKPYLASLAAGNLTYISIRYDPAPGVLVAGRETAVVTGRATIEFKTKAGQLNKRVLTTTTVYARGGRRVEGRVLPGDAGGAVDPNGMVHGCLLWGTGWTGWAGFGAHT